MGRSRVVYDRSLIKFFYEYCQRLKAVDVFCNNALGYDSVLDSNTVKASYNLTSNIVSIKLCKMPKFHQFSCCENFLERHSFRRILNDYVPLTISWQSLLSYRNQSIDLLHKSMDWVLYDNGLRHERINDDVPLNNDVPFHKISTRGN